MLSSFIPCVAVVLLGTLIQIDGAVPMVKRDTNAAPITAKDVNDTCRLKNWPTGQYPDPFDCHNLIKCVNNVTTVITCPNHLVYDKAKKYCNWHYLTPCDTETTTIYPGIPREIKLCHDKHWPNGIFEDPFNCKKFIQCVGEITYITTCPSNELYDPFRKACRRPEKVVCKSRPTPSP